MVVSVGGELIRLVAPNDTQARLDSRVYIRPNYNNALYFDRSGQNFITRHQLETMISRQHPLGKEGEQ